MLWNASWFKRNAPSKKHHLSLGDFERVAVMLSVTKSHNTGKMADEPQGHIKPLEHINKQFARGKRGNTAGISGVRSPRGVGAVHSIKRCNRPRPLYPRKRTS